MRKMIGAALLTLLVSACSAGGAAQGSVQGTGPAGQRSFAVGSFNAVELAGDYDVRVTVGGAPAVRAEGDEAALERLEVRVQNGRLWVGTRSGSWSDSARATIHVTVPSLESAGVAGSGNMQIGALRSPQFRGEVAGSGHLVMERLESESASFEVAGSGNVRAAGRSRQANLEIAGSGTGDLTGLEAENAEISVTGSGGAQVRASGTASVSIAGSGNVSVTGGARCNVSRAGSGNVSCG
ncbi:MAG TPA: head GIN domain-containing protein [Allosphingosinicella sp.]|jgi:hypothetical protein